jgi:aspartyl-tRNA(Asn)/glutamyl-tRNA(Gln) amidotransferase subunit A
MLQRLEANAHLNAFVTVCGDRALEQARQADAKIAASRKQGKPVRRLEGLVVGVKDNLATSGVRTTACSKILENFVPQYDAAVCEQANAAGAIMIGKTNMDEFGMGSATMNTPFGATVNPISSKELWLTAGGSSGGSAAAVAGELCDFSFGSDTGGSVRQVCNMNVCGSLPAGS